ncbi:exo-alpha-sialidase, partial [Trypanosoma cruzi]
WCGVEGVWDECGLLPALQPRVPTRLSRCGFVVGDFPAVWGDVQQRRGRDRELIGACGRRCGTCGGGDNSEKAGGSAWVVRRAAVSFCVLPFVSCVGAPWCVLTRGRSIRRGSCWWWRQSLRVPGALFFLLLFRESVCVSCCCWEWLRRG